MQEAPALRPSSDFDRGLNFCIAQIRSALGDSTEAPVYIRTFPKRGYQFIVPIIVSEEDENPAPATPPAKAPWVLLLAGLIVGVGIAVLWVHHHPATASPVPSTRVAVARFDNETGDTELDRFADALTDSVTEKLTVSGAGHFGVIGNAAILRVPRNQRNLLAIGSSLHAGYVVLAQVRRDSSHCFVLAHLIHLPDQTHACHHSNSTASAVDSSDVSIDSRRSDRRQILSSDCLYRRQLPYHLKELKCSALSPHIFLITIWLARRPAVVHIHIDRQPTPR